VASETVVLGKRRAGEVVLTFAERPGPLQVFVGPARATDEELVNSQTITVDVPGRAWTAGELRVSPILIAPYFWWWWQRWCREYVVRGRVVCADGRPVPGADVCAFDIDWWFW
jgi:hypothetical protein